MPEIHENTRSQMENPTNGEVLAELESIGSAIIEPTTDGAADRHLIVSKRKNREWLRWAEAQKYEIHLSESRTTSALLARRMNVILTGVQGGREYGFHVIILDAWIHRQWIDQDAEMMRSVRSVDEIESLVSKPRNERPLVTTHHKARGGRPIKIKNEYIKLIPEWYVCETLFNARNT